MARTFIGELVLRLKDEMSREAKTAAGNLDTSIDKIQRAARKLNQTTWGGQFEERLRKLGTSSTDIDKLRKSWDSLHTSMTSRDLGKAMQAMEKSNFKTAALSHFSEIATRAGEADTKVRGLTSALKEMAKYGVAGGLLYGGVNAVRGGIVSNAEMMREKDRWRAARIPDSERDAAISAADDLTGKYPSAGLLNLTELARKARAMMGDSERGLAILPDLARAFVALQSAKGTDAAVQELEGFLKGADVAGLNAPGQKGIDSIREVMAGWVRAAQVEGRDLDAGKFLEFARYGKMAVPGLSDRFLGVTVPAIAQDYGPSQMGNALNMAFKAFVIGSNSQAGKKNLQAQRDLGIRVGDGKGQLLNDGLFGSDPYAWVNEVLIPKLQGNGIDTNDNVAVSKALGDLTSNSNASTILTRMITQKQQIDRLLQQYDAAIGPEAADTAAAQDPFVAWKGFTESWRELAAALHGMPEAVAGLNMLTGGIQRFATALREQDGGAQALLAGAGLGAGFAAWKTGSAIWGLITAGTNLNAAAVSLQAAAVSLGGGSVADIASGGKNAGWAATIATWLKWGKGAAIAGSPGVLADLMGATPGDTFEDQVKNQGQYRDGLRRLLGMDSSPLDEHATSAGDYRRLMESVTTPYNPNTPGVSSMFDQPVNEARKAGQDMQSALSVQGNPTVNLAQLQQAVALANQLKAILAGIGPAVAAASSSVANQMNRNFADHGVKP
jgi:hypothetical protein